MDNKKIILFLPYYLSWTVVRHKTNSYFFFLNSMNFFLWIPFKNIFFVNKLLNYFLFECSFYVLKFLNFFLYSWNSFFIKKFIINGRGFKLKKNINCSNWKYNKSHFTKLFLIKSIILKNSKKKLFLLQKNYRNNNIFFFIKNMYNRNIFLKKQIKFSRDYLYLKKKKN